MLVESPHYPLQGTLALGPVPSARDPRATFGPKPAADVVHVATATRVRMEAWTLRFAQAVVEIVGGDRSPAQVLRWSTPTVYADLSRRAQLVQQANQRARQGLEPTPLRSRKASVRPVIASVHLSFITGSVVEASIRVRHGERCRAIAARFENLSGRWQCSALEFA